jgi:hypothetical protein
VIGPLWAGAVIDINMFFPFITGAFIMLLGFLASLIYLRKESLSKAEPVIEATD